MIARADALAGHRRLAATPFGIDIQARRALSRPAE
jgi:hypothetical protein